MKCSIQYNKSGEIISVKAPNGEDSNLFKDAKKDLKEDNLSLMAWSIPYTENFKKTYGDWEKHPQNTIVPLDKNGEPKWTFVKTNFLKKQVVVGSKDVERTKEYIGRSNIKFSKISGAELTDAEKTEGIMLHAVSKDSHVYFTLPYWKVALSLAKENKNPVYRMILSEVNKTQAYKEGLPTIKQSFVDENGKPDPVAFKENIALKMLVGTVDGFPENEDYEAKQNFVTLADGLKESLDQYLPSLKGVYDIDTSKQELSPLDEKKEALKVIGKDSSVIDRIEENKPQPDEKFFRSNNQLLSLKLSKDRDPSKLDEISKKVYDFFANLIEEFGGTIVRSDEVLNKVTEFYQKKYNRKDVEISGLMDHLLKVIYVSEDIDKAISSLPEEAIHFITLIAGGEKNPILKKLYDYAYSVYGEDLKKIYANFSEEDLRKEAGDKLIVMVLQKRLEEHIQKTKKPLPQRIVYEIRNFIKNLFDRIRSVFSKRAYSIFLAEEIAESILKKDGEFFEYLTAYHKKTPKVDEIQSVFPKEDFVVRGRDVIYNKRGRRDIKDVLKEIQDNIDKSVLKYEKLTYIPSKDSIVMRFAIMDENKNVVERVNVIIPTKDISYDEFLKNIVSSPSTDYSSFVLANFEGNKQMYFNLTPNILDRKPEGETYDYEESKKLVDQISNEIIERSKDLISKYDPEMGRNRMFSISQNKFIENTATKQKMFIDEDDLISEGKKQVGRSYHEAMSYIIDMMVDKDGNVNQSKAETIYLDYLNDVDSLKKEVGEILSKVAFPENISRDALESSLAEMTAYVAFNIKNLPKGSRILKEVKVFDGKNTGGIIDYLAVMPHEKNGFKLDILDWKFVEQKPGSISPISGKMRKKYQTQIETYKNILKTAGYGIKEKDFRYQRIIPFILEYEYRRKENTGEIDVKVKNVKVANPNPFLIEDPNLLPIPTLTERVESKFIDSYLDILQRQFESMSVKATTLEQKQLVRTKLAKLAEAIRYIQVQRNLRPLLNYTNEVLNKSSVLLDELNKMFKGEGAKELLESDNLDLQTQRKISDISLRLMEYSHFLEQIQSINEQIVSSFAEKILEGKSGDYIPLKDRQKIENELNAIKSEFSALSSKTKDAIDLMNTSKKIIIDKFVAEKRNIHSILDPEAQITALQNLFNFVSTGTIASVDLLYKMVSAGDYYYTKKTQDFAKRLFAIIDEIKKVAKSRGIPLTNPQKVYEILFKKDKSGRYVHELVSPIKEEYFEKLKEAVLTKDEKWIKENVDVDKYLEELKKLRDDAIKEVDEEYVMGESNRYRLEMDQQYKKEYENQIKSIQNIFGTEEIPNYFYLPLLKKFANRDKWMSDEYKELLRPENKPYLDMYNLITELNNRAAEIGYLANESYEGFLPFITSTIIEKIFEGEKLNLKSEILKAVSVDEKDLEFTQVTDVNGELVRSIPRPYTRPKGKEIYDEKGNLVAIDYSDMSKDLGRSIYAYAHALFRYEYLSSIEGQISILKEIERNKGMLELDQFGNIKFSNIAGMPTGNPVTAQNNVNYRYLERMINAYIYSMLETTEKDTALGKIESWSKSKLNQALGEKLFLGKDNDRIVSFNKIWRMASHYYHIKTLGWNIPVSIVSFFAGSTGAMINAGDWFSAREFAKNELKVFTGYFDRSEEHKKELAVLNFFMPYIEHSQAEHARDFAAAGIEKLDGARLMMWLLQSGDRVIQTATFLSLIENSTIDPESKKIMTVKDYVGKTLGYYKRMYDKNLTYEERRQIREEFEKKVEEIKKEKNLFKLAKVNLETAEVEFEGIPEFSETFANFRTFGQNIVRRSQTHLVGMDLNGLRLSMIGRAMLMFKNWIPRAVHQRYADLHYDPGIDKYDWGRIRMFGRLLFKEGVKLGKALHDIISMYKVDDRGISELEKLYYAKKEEYYRKHGKELRMTKEDFYEMVRLNLKRTLKEFLFVVVLSSMFAFAKASSALDYKDEEDPGVKSFYKYVHRMLERGIEALTFYYNPQTIFRVLSGSMIPPAMLVKDIYKVLETTLKEGYGYLTGDEELVEKEHPVKYMMNSMWFLKELEQYMAIFAPDWAKELGIQINPHLFVD